MGKHPGSTAGLIVLLVVGALVGALLGEIIRLLFPGGILEQLFARGVSPGLSPTTMDLRVLSLTFGFTVRLNLASLLGIGLALYFYRRL
ncbi:MAG: DUF4321 domain-containing protein [candidate division NC10 bacterium]|nr:DUF4321 domain-containing protein [candidate division NC10 bacterium]MBI3003521.1 DUF4321 domain-containing protein [candidate division NC10 bacterium]MBI4391050.1 DUF4321 domain-containing protein [candidate division NC10 bacterium]